MSDINEIKKLIAESEGLELSNWNTATHAQREAWASIETQGRAWIIDFITTIESQKEEIEKLNFLVDELNKSNGALNNIAERAETKVGSLKAITELKNAEIERLQGLIDDMEMQGIIDIEQDEIYRG